MNEDTPNPKKSQRTCENTGLYPAPIVINDRKDTTESGVQTRIEKPAKLALNEKQLAYFRRPINIRDKVMI